MRWMPQVFVCVCVMLAAGSARAYQIVDTDPCPGYPVYARALGSFEVKAQSHVVVMEYSVRYGANAYAPDPQILPDASLQPYESGSCGLIRKQAEYFVAMGVDAVAIDLSNAIRCAFAPDSSWCQAPDGTSQYPPQQQMLSNINRIYNYYRYHQVPVRLIPMLGAKDSSLWESFSQTDPNDTAFRRGLEFFDSLAAAASASVLRYQGRPLMLVDVGAPIRRAYPAPTSPVHDFQADTVNAIATSGKANSFTYRFISGYLDSQSDWWKSSGLFTSSGLHEINWSQYPIWSNIDRNSVPGAAFPFAATYSLAPDAPQAENFTVTSAYSAQCFASDPVSVCWDPAHGAGLRGDPANRRAGVSDVLTSMMDKARSVLQPRFLLVNGFNFRGQPDQGSTWRAANDLEPTAISGDQGWGNEFMDLVTAEIKKYKSALPRASNLSTRGYVGSGDPLIVGFIVDGPGPRKVALRARGPSLQPYFDPGTALMNPQFTLLNTSVNPPTKIASSDDWCYEAGASDVAASGFAPSDCTESALVITLDPGSYSMVISGAGSGNLTGLAIGELFAFDVDGDANIGHPISNLSSRAFVGTGNYVMIAGINVAGDRNLKAVIRARGRSLAGYVPNTPLQNPTIQVIRGSDQAVIASNNDWHSQDAAAVADIAGSGFAPYDDLESAVSVSLPQGGYTIIVSGNGGIGDGIVEIFTR